MKQTERDSNKRIAFPIQLFGEGSTDAQVPSEIHVVPTGKWDHPVYGEMEITTAHIREFVQNFKDKVRRDIPITQGHDNGMSGGELPAIGWFTDVVDRGVNGLWAGVRWTDEGVQLLERRAFKYFSPEFYEMYEDPETRKKYSHVLVGGALTNKPYFKELEAVVAFSEPSIIHQFSDHMELKDIVSKKAEELSDEEKEFLVEHKDELNDEQKGAFESVLSASGDEGNDGDEDGSGANDGNGDAGDDGKGEGDKGVQASEGKGKVITMSEAEVKALRAKADAGARAFAEVEKMKLDKEVDRLVFSQTNPDGKLLPKQKEAVVKLMRTLSEPQRDQLRNIVSNLPKISLSFSEAGDGGKNEPASAADEVDAKVQEKIKASEGKLNYSDALRAVFAENPDLHTRYSEEGVAE
jgi:phage I-like protein